MGGEREPIMVTSSDKQLSFFNLNLKVAHVIYFFPTFFLWKLIPVLENTDRF